MRFSKSWIDEWVDTGISADQLSDIITMAGLEVDTVEKVAGDFDHVVVGLVAECADHPNSDHLSVCRVTSETVNFWILCAALLTAARV